VPLTKPKPAGIPGWSFERRKDPSFKFLPDPHEYHLKGERLWSPSGVFVEVRYVDLSRYKEEDRYRGSWVHRATHLYDEGDLDWKAIPPEYLGFVEGYCEFKELYKFKPRLIETPIYHPKLLYGVTPDREGLILQGDPSIVELKTGTMLWWTAYQTAAQDLAIGAFDKTETFRRRFGVELKKTGKFRVKEFEDPDDYLTWQQNLGTVKAHYKQPPTKAVVEGFPF
jgi:hypothetical protein